MKQSFSLIRKTVLTLLVSAVSLMAYAQQSVSGVVNDATGEPLIGVSILVKGTTNGTVTDFDGNFALDGVKADNVLVFSYMGYANQEVTVGNQKVIKVTMSEDTQTIDEVVVVGYGQMKKNDLTGSVSSVGTDALTAKGTTGALEALQGTVAGVSITQASGRVGGGFDVEIRGKSSTNSDTKPIYVVDGMICDDIDWLNPQDIERIDVLKDASSTAIYGSRATAGVVQISTKSGASQGKKEKKPSISYDGYVGWVNPVRMNNFMDGQEFYNYRFMKFLKYAGGVDESTCGSQPVYQMADAGFKQMALYNDGTNPNTIDYMGHYRLKDLMSENATYNWPGMVTRNAFQHNHYLAVSGSSEHIAYHMGIGYNEDEGVFIGDKQRRVNFKGSMDVTINKYVQAGLNFNASYLGNDYANDQAVQYAFRANPFFIPRDKEGNLIEQPGNCDAMGSVSANQFSNQINPLIYQENQTKHKDAYRMMGNVYLQVVPVKGLTIKSMFSPGYRNSKEGQFDGTLAAINDENIAQTKQRSYFDYTWDNTINYSETFKEKHSVNIMGLYSLTGGKYEETYLRYTGVMDGTLWYNMGTGTYVGDGDNKSYTSYSEWNMISWAIRANYSYAGKYMITATVRGDGSSKFATGHKWGYFPSVALAWRMSEENWMKNAEWLTNLKWRLSYGVTGNNTGISNYATQQTVTGPIYYPFGGSYAQGFYPNAIVDSNLSWEKSSEWNAGVDFGFLRDRISGSVDFYNKVSSDLLFKVQLPLEAGGGKLTTNVGSVLNRGVEVSLKTVNVDVAGVRWETSFTLAHNTNRVLDINGSGEDLPEDGLFIGKSINNVYGYQNGGIISNKDMVVPAAKEGSALAQKYADHGIVAGQTMRECDYYYACYGQTEGQPFIKDANYDGKYDEDDKKVYCSDPLVTGSLTSTLTYKGFEFQFSLYGKYGNTVSSAFYGEYLNYNDRGRMHLNMDYYIPAGTLIGCDGINPDGSYLNPKYQEVTHYGSYPMPQDAAGNSGLGANATQWLDGVNKIVDASYLKVKNITLAYSLQKRELEKMHMQKFRIYCTITNPLVATSYMGFDPEWAHASLKNDAPSTLNVQVGVNLKF